MDGRYIDGLVLGKERSINLLKSAIRAGSGNLNRAISGVSA